MLTYAKAPGFLEVERMYQDYGELFGNMLYGAFNLDDKPRQHLVKVAVKAFKRSPVKIRHLISDALAGARAL